MMVREGFGQPLWRGKLAVGVGLVTCLAVVAACGSADQDSSTTGVTTAGTSTSAGSTSTAPETGGEPSVLIVGISDLGTMRWNPKEAGSRGRVASGMWGEQLLMVNPETGLYEGLLAESYSVSDDLMTWTFTLRPDIPFHDDWGTVTSEDVKFTWEQYIHPDSNQGLRSQMAQAVDDNMDNFEIVSDLEFRLHTTNPIAILDYILHDGTPGPLITSKRYFDEVGEEAAAAHPIGTGPWKFVSSTPGVEVVMEAVEDHWRQPPAFDMLILKEIPDGPARLAQLQSGGIDIADLPHGLIGEAQSAGLDIFPTPNMNNISIVFGGMYYGQPELDEDSPWIQADNPEQGLAIRQAMSLAIDRDLIIEQLMGGFAERSYVGHLPNHPQLIDPAWTLPVYDLDQARQRLADGGYPDGFPITLPIWDGAMPTAVIAEAVAGMWEELGLQVTRVPHEQSTLEELQETRQTAGLAYVYHGPTRGPEPAPMLIFITTDRPDGKWLDPVVEDYYRQLGSIDNLTDRLALAVEVANYMIDNQLQIPLFYAPVMYGIGPKVGEWELIPGLNLPNGFDTVTPAG